MDAPEGDPENDRVEVREIRDQQRDIPPQRRDRQAGEDRQEEGGLLGPEVPGQREHDPREEVILEEAEYLFERSPEAPAGPAHPEGMEHLLAGGQGDQDQGAVGHKRLEGHAIELLQECWCHLSEEGLQLPHDRLANRQ